MWQVELYANNVHTLVRRKLVFLLVSILGRVLRGKECRIWSQILGLWPRSALY